MWMLICIDVSIKTVKHWICTCLSLTMLWKERDQWIETETILENISWKQGLCHLVTDHRGHCDMYQSHASVSFPARQGLGIHWVVYQQESAEIGR